MIDDERINGEVKRCLNLSVRLMKPETGTHRMSLNFSDHPPRAALVTET